MGHVGHHYPPQAFHMPYPYQSPYPHVMSLAQTQTQPAVQIQPTQMHAQNTNSNQNQKRQYNEKRRVFDPIPVSYSELLPQLIAESLIVPFPLPPTQPPYPKGYDANATCEYHAGTIGHSTENCYGLKHRVQDLIEAKRLVFKENSPNIGNDPSPKQEGSSSN